MIIPPFRSLWKTGTPALPIQLGHVLLQRLGLIRKPPLFRDWPGPGHRLGQSALTWATEYGMEDVLALLLRACELADVQQAVLVDCGG